MPKLTTDGAMMEPGATNSAPTRSTVLLKPVDVPKASDVLARELRERILSGELVEGTALPAERELVKQTQMSRATVREALRILEVQNLVRVRAGRAGGAFVQRLTSKSMASSVSMLIRGQRIKLADLMETREALEPFCAELAARNRTDDDLAVLNQANKDIADPEADLSAFLQANLDWHVGVAVAGHNELLIGFMTALSHAIYTGTENPAFVDEDVRAVTARAHRSITTAIRSRDTEAASRRMRRHVHSYAKAALAMDEREAIAVDD
jgi:GntR family transcriptional repressor for pyruvate dehydrogenase complex